MAVNLATITTLNRVRLYEGQPGTSVATVYTVPATTDVAVKSIVLCNTTGTAAVVSAYVVPSAGTAGVINQILNGQSVPGNSTTIIDFPQGLNMTVGDFLALSQVTTGAITVYVSAETYA